MEQQKKFFEFLCELIDIQIKKYKSLAGIGVGPDALINSYLVWEEVKELLTFAEKILAALQVSSSYLNADIVKQTQFYLEQEHLRAKAGWLLDDNVIHTPALERVTYQLKQLKILAEEAEIEIESPVMPSNTSQRQCQHDSHAIAFLILEAAKNATLSADPEAEFDLSLIPAHALRIIKRNATGRYTDPQFAVPIEEMYQTCKQFIDTSTLKKTLLKAAATTTEAALTVEMSITKAKAEEKKDRHHLNALLLQYKQLAPDSPLFQEGHPWYEIGKIPQQLMPKNDSLFSREHLTFFGKAAVVGLSAYMLVSYLWQSETSPGLSTTY